MHKYFIKIPWIVKKFFPNYVWDLNDGTKSIYLSFDDGPHPTITPWVLEELEKYNAAATFFCIGKNVALYPEVYKQIVGAGHAVGNHTYQHLNGWETDDKTYLADIQNASKLIRTGIFRPPYGRIRTRQARQLKNFPVDGGLRIIMWDVLSGDFDPSFSPQHCIQNVQQNVTAGSIIVFHDSEKAFPNLRVALPATLAFLKESGYAMKKME